MPSDTSSPAQSATRSGTLSVERLFSDPALNGELPSHIKFSADGKQIAWLQVSEDDRERLDLWLYDVAARETRLGLDSSQIGQSGVLSDAEKAERERRRQFTGGVTNFHWHPDNALIAVEADGGVYLLTAKTGEISAITGEKMRQTHLKFSPDGSHLAFVRDYNLWLYDLESSQERQLTTGGTALCHYGLPEFIAQEEMHRFDGYWWTADSRALVYTKVDNGTVSVSQRYEIDAEEFRVIEQRYPYAGAANATVELALHKIDGSEEQWLDWRSAPDDYLARVTCHADDLYVQVQDRSQQLLQLKRFSLAEPEADASILLSETSDTWISLHNNFKPLSNGSFLWTSSRGGHEHLYLYRARGDAEPVQITSGRSAVRDVLYADDNAVLFSGWLTEPTEQHLYRASIGSETLNKDQSVQVEHLTSGEGWHDTVVAESGNVWVDRHSHFALPAQLELCEYQEGKLSNRETIASLNIDNNHPYATYLDNHVTPSMGSITGVDGKPLYYRLTEPAQRTSGKRYPLVVYVYGGPGGARVNWAWPPLLLQLFANQGFGVLELDNRGTGNRSKAFDDAIYLQMGKVEVEDQLLGVEFLRTVDWVDSERLGVFGHSYGGYMTLMSMARAPDVFKAGVSVAPVSQWQLYDTHYTERYLSTPAKNPKGYSDSAVFPYLENLRGDLLLMHGMADDNVLFTHSTKLYKALQDQGIAFQMMTYPGSKHALHERTVSIHRFEALFKFFLEKL